MCTDDQYQCLLSGVCLNGSLLCDGVNHCGYFEDELACGLGCSIHQLTCANGRCLTTSLDNSTDPDTRCDTFNDCGDHSDELFCDLITSPKLTVDTCKPKQKQLTSTLSSILQSGCVFFRHVCGRQPGVPVLGWVLCGHGFPV